MAHQTDYQAITAGTYDVEQADGTRPGEITGYRIPVLISDAEAATLLAAYDEADSGSPDANTSRELARCILSALKRYTGS